MSSNEFKDIDKSLAALLKLGDYMVPIMEEQAKKVEEYAKEGAAEHTGELSNSITHETTKETNGNEWSVRSDIYTDCEYASYIEYGTGPVGEQNHEGINPKAEGNITYKSTGWMIPVDRISEEDAKFYNFLPVKKNGEIIGYYTLGQAAKPFMYPAVADHSDEIYKEIEDAVSEVIKKCWD